MRDRNQFAALGYGIDNRLRVQIALRININPFQHHPIALAQKMPGHDIGMMLHHRKDNFIACG